ncbi:MAG: hypothetical protein A3F74_05730 [Betaproteobacteria bacterium RIFCSPLOWO2_12_FULL_62_58]|nr:MAG: hypothetical protein A3F74_05730 [Betaproteobacteria bacterium RIFCSPLOWO2_12_FULL_62_58]
MKEDALREQIATIGKSLYDRGLAHGSAGNISVRLADGWLMTPTNSCLGRFDPARISRFDTHGRDTLAVEVCSEYHCLYCDSG